MNKKFLRKIGVGIAMGVSLLPFLALALAPSVPGPIVTGPDSIMNIVEGVLRWLGAIVLSISVIMFLYAAIVYLFAGANATALTKAKDVLVYAIIGTIIAVLAWSIPAFIVRFLAGSI